MSSRSFARMATKTATTKRSPTISGGKRGEPAAYLTGIACIPLDPADSQTARDLAFRIRQETGRPVDFLQTFVDANTDIREGDVLVVGGTDYPVRHVAEWDWNGTNYLHILVEELRP